MIRKQWYLANGRLCKQRDDGLIKLTLDLKPSLL